TTRDLARELATVRDHLSEASSPELTKVSGTSIRPALGMAVGAVVLGLAAGFFAGRAVWNTAGKPPTFHRLTFRSGEVRHARLAPDGQTVVYSAAWGTDPIGLFSTRRGSVESRSLGEPGADLLSISLSAEMLVLRNGTLARVSLAGGAEREILES